MIAVVRDYDQHILACPRRIYVINQQISRARLHKLAYCLQVTMRLLKSSLTRRPNFIHSPGNGKGISDATVEFYRANINIFNFGALFFLRFSCDRSLTSQTDALYV